MAIDEYYKDKPLPGSVASIIEYLDIKGDSGGILKP